MSKYNNIFKAQKIAVIVLNKTVDLISSDKNINNFSKTITISTINKFTPQITKYILSMKEEDAEKLINKIKDVITEGDIK